MCCFFAPVLAWPLSVHCGAFTLSTASASVCLWEARRVVYFFVRVSQSVSAFYS